jgi:hypothetical protein
MEYNCRGTTAKWSGMAIQMFVYKNMSLLNSAFLKKNQAPTTTTQALVNFIGTQAL